MKYVRVIGIIFVFFLLFLFLNRLVSPKYRTSLVEGSMTSAFYKEKMNHEIIFLGDCEVYANISPMVLYEEEGITSYVRGNSKQLLPQSYYVLKETLHYEIPKYVIFNVNALRYTEEEKSESYNRLMMDEMKWSKEKLAMIKASMTEEETIFSYIFPILRYHDRITNLTTEDFEYFFQDKQTTYNGFLINKNIKSVTTLPTKKILGSYDFPKENMEYLEKIVQLCEENKITLIFIKAPSLYPYWYEEYDSNVQEFAKENHIDYYNFTEEISEIGLDFSTDTYDGGLHLNLNGATKFSRYLAKLLKENYSLKDYRLDKEVSNIYNKKQEEYKKETES